MKGSEEFKRTIKKYLDEFASENPEFKARLELKSKSLDGCIGYIFSEVKKSGMNGFADEEIYGMAVHYYDEDNIKAEKVSMSQVIVNHHVELTEEEKKKAHDDAVKRLQDETIARMKKAAAPKKTREMPKNVVQLDMFAEL